VHVDHRVLGDLVVPAVAVVVLDVARVLEVLVELVLLGRAEVRGVEGVVVLVVEGLVAVLLLAGLEVVALLAVVGVAHGGSPL
jgi:hypothetical protein